MAEEIRRVEHYSASIPNKLGEGARVLGALREAGVNLTAFWGYPAGKGRAQLEFIPEDSATFAAAAKQTKLRVRKSIASYIHGDDRPSAIADMLAKLAGARINVAAVQAVCGGGEATEQSFSFHEPLLARLQRFWGRHSAEPSRAIRQSLCQRLPSARTRISAVRHRRSVFQSRQPFLDYRCVRCTERPRRWHPSFRCKLLSTATEKSRHEEG
jgi:hypothetical protein